MTRVQVGGYQNMYGVADWLAQNADEPNAPKKNANKPNAAGGNDIGTAVVSVAPDIVLVAPSNELQNLRATLGDANFLALGGDDRAVKVVFASQGTTGAAAEVATISDADKLIDLYTLADMALKDPVLTKEKKAVLEQVKKSAKERLGTVLSKPCKALGEKLSPWDCFAQLPTYQIVLLVVAVLFLIALFSYLISLIYKGQYARKQVKRLRSGGAGGSQFL